MPQPSAAEFEVLMAQVHQRLLESGEWDRIRLMLATKLNDSGWTDELHHRSKETARGMATSTLSFTKLFEETLSMTNGTANAGNNVPNPVRREVTALIKTFLDKQFE
uniref:Enhancer of yellow 2 transcriptional factor-like protein n=1 Tax=Mycena chlorophos TaxID=658473 RepID=A0ABQ0LS35_MYCCL|nr:enhancer of yellow 2 transcriptional factor-like protein [Mycena chlorophos]